MRETRARNSGGDPVTLAARVNNDSCADQAGKMALAAFENVGNGLKASVNSRGQLARWYAHFKLDDGGIIRQIQQAGHSFSR